MRPIDADAVVDVICDLHIGGKDGVANALPNTYGADIREIIEQIDSLPSLDAVEVVRCKDCKHRHLDGMIWNCPFGLSGGEGFFCAYGAKDGGQND